MKRKLQKITFCNRSQNLLKAFIPTLFFLGLFVSKAYAQVFTETFDIAPCGGTLCNSFSKTLAGVQFDFVFTSDGGGGNFLRHPQFGEDNSPSMNVQSNGWDLSSTQRFTIKRNDGESFNFNSIYLRNGNNQGQVVTVQGIINGNPVGSPAMVSDGQSGTYNFEGITVDEISFTSNDFFNFNFDSFHGEIVTVDLPTVTTSSASSISNTSATVGGNIADDGGAAVTERGIVYSTDSDPTTDGHKIQIGTGTGPFSQTITELLPGTLYYIRAYAINSVGTVYGPLQSFTTNVWVTSILRHSPTSQLTNSSSVVYQVNLDGPVEGINLDMFSFVSSGLSSPAISEINGSGSSYEVTVNTGSGNGWLRLNLANSSGTSPTIINPLPFNGEIYTIDKTPPTVNIGSTVSNPTNENLILVSFTFSEPVTGFTFEDIAVTGATLSNFNGSGDEYTVDVSPSGDGEITINIAAGAAQDQAGNDNEAATQFNIVSDRTAPALAISSDETSPNNASPIPVKVKFSEPVTGFTIEDIAVTGATLSNFNGSGDEYTVDVSPSGDGEITINIAAGAAQDQAGNDNEAATQFNIVYQTPAPSDISLSNASIDENVAANSIVGTFTTTHPIIESTFAYSLVTGTGDTDNSAFSINGNELRINYSPEFITKNSYSIRIRSTDQEGLFFEKEFNIIIIEVIKTITGITFEGDSFVYNGTEQSIEITGTLPTGTSVIYNNNTRVIVGSQTVTATVSGPGYIDLVLTADLEIIPATITGITFEGDSFEFDCTEQVIEISGILPTGTSVIYNNNKRVDVGTQIATATISGSNYVDLVLEAELEIIPATIAAIDLGGNRNICYNDILNLSVLGDFEEILWFNESNGEIANGNSLTYTITSSDRFWVEATNANNCISTASLNVTVISLPQADAGPDKMICEGDFVEIGPAPQDGFTYEWSPANGLSSAIVANPTASPSQTTEYTLMVTNAEGCSSTSTVLINVASPTELYPNYQTSICIGESVLFENILSPNIDIDENLLSYEWSPKESLDNPYILNPLANPQEPSTYLLIVKAGECVISQTEVFVNVHPLPETTISEEISIGYNETTSLKATGGLYYEWSPSEGLNRTDIAEPEASPTVTTTYTALITNESGCQVEQTIKVNVSNEIFIPTLFTPNDDGQNDLFLVYGFGIHKIDFHIFNKNGTLVYQTQNVSDIMEKGWDGTFRGRPLESGFYVWVMNAEFMDGSKALFDGKNTGIVQLLR